MLRPAIDPEVQSFIEFLQNCGGREFNEDEAEQLAQKIVDEWLASGGGR